MISVIVILLAVLLKKKSNDIPDVIPDIILDVTPVDAYGGLSNS